MECSVENSAIVDEIITEEQRDFVEQRDFEEQRDFVNLEEQQFVEDEKNLGNELSSEFSQISAD